MDMAFPPTIPCLLLFLAAVSQERPSWGQRAPPASALWALPLGIFPCCCCHRPVHCRLGIGWWCLSVSTTCHLKSKVHLCVQRWRDIHGLSLCRTGLLSSIQTFFISRRVKIWPEEQNATNMYRLFKWFRPERHLSASQITLCEVKLLRNIDLETDVFLPWHHQFLKNMSLSQPSSLSQP